MGLSVTKVAIFTRRHHYARAYGKAVFALFLMILVNFALITMITYIAANRKIESYYSTASNGKIMPIRNISILKD